MVRPGRFVQVILNIYIRRVSDELAVSGAAGEREKEETKTSARRLGSKTRLEDSSNPHSQGRDRSY